MPHECFDGDERRTIRQSIGGTRVAQRMTTGLHTRGCSIPLHLLLHRRDRKRPRRALLIPEDRRPDSVCGAAGQAGSPRRHGIRREVDPPILPAFAWYDVNGVRRPVEIVHREGDHLGTPQTTPEHAPEEGLIPRVVDRRKERLDLALRESFRERPPPAHHVTRVDRIPSDAPVLAEIVEDMFQRVQASREGGRGEPLCVRLVNTPRDVLT
jgi:hypothetical protein